MAIKKYKASEETPALEINSATISQLPKYFNSEKIDVLKGNLESVVITLDSVKYDEKSDEVVLNFSNDLNEKVEPERVHFSDFADSLATLKNEDDSLNMIEGFKKYVKSYTRKLALVVFYNSAGKVILNGLTIKGLYSEVNENINDVHINFCSRGVTMSNIPKEHGLYELIHLFVMGIEIETFLNNHLWTEKPDPASSDKVIFIGDHSMISINDYTDLGVSDDISDYPQMFEDLELVPDYDDIEPIIVCCDSETLFVKPPHESNFVLINSPIPVQLSSELVDSRLNSPVIIGKGFGTDVTYTPGPSQSEWDPIEHEDNVIADKTETANEDDSDYIDWDF